ncbi:MAG: hypothetical protein IPJ77_06715 [Planctomycetes bacterium]|nr:hypothetical protein [Planctomycetota bacterium]
MDTSTHAGARNADLRDETRTDRLALLFVAVVTVALLLRTLEFVSTWGSRIPVQDDMEMACYLVPGWQVSWGQLWAPANEHRIVLPRLVFLGLLRLTHDFRSPLFFQVWTHAALAIGMALFARRLRGRSSYADAFFPLFWLGLANAENFLLGMQVATDLSVVFVCVALASFCWSREPMGIARASVVVLAMLLLPFNGGFGLSQVPALAALCAWSAWTLRKDPARRGAVRVLAAGVLLLVPLFLAYFHGLRSGTMERAPFEVGKMLVIAGQVLTLNFGPAAHVFPWPASVATALVVLLAVAFAVRALVREPGERRRALAGLVVMTAPVATALGIGIGRQAAWPDAGWADRYVTLPSVLFATAYVVFVLHGGAVLGRAAQGALYSAFLLLVPFHVQYGEYFGRKHAEPITDLYLDAQAGTPLAVLVERYHQKIYADPEGFRNRLQFLASAGMPPFEQQRRQSVGVEAALGRPIAAFASPAEPRSRYVGGSPMLIAACDAEIELDVPSGAKRVRGRLAVPYGMVLAAGESDPSSIAVRFEVLARFADDARRELHALQLEPLLREEDRGPKDFSLELPAGTVRVVLRALDRAPKRDAPPWAGYGGLAFE